MLVCPDCGHEEFTATLTTRTRYEYTFSDDGYMSEHDSEVVDGGDTGDVDSFECTDCGASYCDPASELVSEETYSDESLDI